MQGSSGWRLGLGSGVAIAVLVALLVWKPVGAGRGAAASELLLFCAAGVKVPVESIASRFEQEYGVKVQVQYGGSGTLLSNMELSRCGDLFIAADDSYIQTALAKGLVAEVLPVAMMRPVIAVLRGNPKRVAGLGDLLTNAVGFALANPEAAAVGHVVRDALGEDGGWARLQARCRVLKPTVTDIANDVKLGVVDAGIVWDATVGQYPELESVVVPELTAASATISVAVLRSSRNPTVALKLARYFSAVDKGLRDFRAAGYRTVDGDDWAETPELVLFSGGVNRLAIEETIRGFEKREGAQVTRVYNGCGILVSQMKSGQRLDAYLACDRLFMEPVSNRMIEVEDVSATDLVIVTKKGNPASIGKLADLGRPGLKVGLAHEGQSALGARSRALLESAGLYAEVASNVVVRTPTADLLVNQLRAGALDAAMVYRANTSVVGDKLEVIGIDLPDAQATQPIGIERQGRHPYLARRLKAALLGAESRKRFEAAGFVWKGRAHD